MQRSTFNHQQFQFKENTFFAGTFSIPTKILQKPPKSRLLHDLDDAFLPNLTIEMEKVPEGNYGIIYVCAIDCTKGTFDSSKVNQYKYEILRGHHNTVAAKNLLAKFPNNEHFLKRHARVMLAWGTRLFGLVPDITWQPVSGMRLNSRRRYVVHISFLLCVALSSTSA